jgi:hypothetical protein
LSLDRIAPLAWNVSTTRIFILSSNFILGSEFILVSKFILGSDFILGRIGASVKLDLRLGMYLWLKFYPWVGIYPWLGMILDWDWILGSDFTLGKIGHLVGLEPWSNLSLARILTASKFSPSARIFTTSDIFTFCSDFQGFGYFILSSDFPFLSFLQKILTKQISNILGEHMPCK